MKTVYILAMMLLLTLGIAIADSSHLELDKIEIRADGKLLLTTSGDGSIKVKPGQELEIRATLRNTYDDDTYNDIEDVIVTANIEGMDETDHSDRVDVRADGKRTVTLQLEIPEEASSLEDYDLEIRARGYDANGTLQDDESIIDLEVDRKDHDLEFTKFHASDVFCDEDFTTIKLELKNTGEDEETDVELRIENAKLGTMFFDRFDLASVIDDKDNNYELEKRVSIVGLKKGRYTIQANVRYDDGRTVEEETDLNIQGCGEESTYAASDEDEYRIEQTTERYSNPNRDLTFLFREDQGIVVDMPPLGTPKLTVNPAKEDNTFGITVLLIANLIIAASIALLVIPSYREDRREADKKQEFKFKYEPFYK